MLKQRIITAAILIPLFIFLVLKLSPPYFALLTGVMVLIAAWEWSTLMEVKSPIKKIIYPVIIGLLLFASLTLSTTGILTITCIWWVSALILVIRYPNGSGVWGSGVIVRSLMGLFVLVPCWRAIIFIHSSGHDGPYRLLFLFILIWGADSAAYFVGRACGKHKLAPVVSPGKTWEGALGAIVFTTAISLCALYFTQTPHRVWLGAIILTCLIVIFSIIGDLFESMLKRKAGVKDSGSIFPGHGGILDRIDSLTAAAPFFALGALLLGKIYY